MHVIEYDGLRCYLMLICMFKVFHDAGIPYFKQYNANFPVNDLDYYYEYAMEGIQNAAPIVKNNAALYDKYGYEAYEDEMQIWAYSSKEMQTFYKLARQLNRLEGRTKEQYYEKAIEEEIESIRNFESYNFDYQVGNKRRGAQLELLWYHEFYGEVEMSIWIVRVMELFKIRLPELKRCLCQARRRKNRKEGAMRYAGNE